MNQRNIDVINICLDTMATFGNEQSKADIKAAKEAFEIVAEKQIPKPPKDIDYEFSYFKCGNCGELIIWTASECEHKFCLECGQAIKWEGKP